MELHSLSNVGQLDAVIYAGVLRGKGQDGGSLLCCNVRSTPQTPTPNLSPPQPVACDGRPGTPCGGEESPIRQYAALIVGCRLSAFAEAGLSHNGALARCRSRRYKQTAFAGR